MNKEPVPLHDDKPFLIRLKEVDMSDEDFKKEMSNNNHMLIRDTRGRIFKLAWLRGEFLRTDIGNKEFPIIARVRERLDGNFELLNIVSEPAELTKETEAEEEKSAM